MVRVDIVTRADADADHDAHRLAAIEVGDILLRQRGVVNATDSASKVIFMDFLL